jgi:hypothetical protein
LLRMSRLKRLTIGRALNFPNSLPITLGRVCTFA